MKFNKNFIILVIAAIVLYLIIMALLFFRNNSDNWNEARTDYLMVGYNAVSYTHLTLPTTSRV